jgi:hypothetical protein
MAAPTAYIAKISFIPDIGQSKNSKYRSFGSWPWAHVTFLSVLSIVTYRLSIGSAAMKLTMFSFGLVPPPSKFHHQIHIRVYIGDQVIDHGLKLDVNASLYSAPAQGTSLRI